MTTETNNKEALDLINNAKEGDTIIWDERESSKATELIKEINEEFCNNGKSLDWWFLIGKAKGLLTAYQEELEFLKSDKMLFARHSEDRDLNETIEERIQHLESEIKILESMK